MLNLEPKYMPSVTVLMPVYNGVAFLQEAIDSILSQSFSDFELLIIDDGSTDGTGKLVDLYDDARIVYHRNPTNFGIVKTLNMGLELARGEFIARMDADDISLPDRLIKQFNYMTENPDVGLCGGLYWYIGQYQLGSYWPKSYKEVFTLLGRFCCIKHPTVMIRRNVLTKYNIRYESKYQWAEDYALWLEIAMICRVEVLPDILLHYRWHDNNIGRSKSSEQKVLGNLIRQKWFELILERSITQSEFDYLFSKGKSLDILRVGWKLLDEVMSKNTLYPIDKKLFGRLMAREWLAEMISFSVYQTILAIANRRKFFVWADYSFRQIIIALYRKRVKEVEFLNFY